MKRIALGISALVLIVAGAGFAAEERGQMPPSQLSPETRAEAQTRAEHLFDKLDLNHDGMLDQADRAARMAEVFDRIDTNHDGTISRSEFAAAPEHSMRLGHGPDEMGSHGDHPGGADGAHRRMGHWGYSHRELDGLVMLILKRADPAHTGAVTRDAFVKAALSLFDEADSNHDGVLTPAEHRAFAQAMRQHIHADWEKHGGEAQDQPDGGMPPPGPPPPPVSPH